MAENQSGDTQWPAFLVFQQKDPSRPHQHAGSVHAPDPELALMNARDVFVRRPPCVSLWVAPADAVYARTREELESWAPRPETGRQEEGELERYCVFIKARQKESCSFHGAVDAGSPAGAMALALERFSPPQALWWWVIPERLISKTEVEDEETLFEPATRKVFRHQSSFNTLTLMRQIATEPTRPGKAQEEDEGHEP